MAGKGTEKSQGGGGGSYSAVKTRHSIGGGGVGSGSRVRSVKSSSTTNRKRYSEPRRLESPDGAFTVLERVSTPPTLTGSASTTASRGGGGVKMKTRVPKPISPDPSESSACKTVCSSPDLNGETSSAALDALWPSLDTHSLQLENRHLKELLVSQLDLIQQQSETILSREKQLKDLRMENEHLRQRLERMERRVRGGDEAPAPAPSPAVSSSVSSSREALTPAPTNSRKRAHPSSSSADSSVTTPLVVPSKRIKRESGGSYSIVAARNSTESRASVPPPPADLKPATPSAPSVTATKVRRNSSISIDPKPSVKESEELVEDFPRFDELTDEIFEESDIRFRISSEENKSSDSASSCDSVSLSDRTHEVGGGSTGDQTLGDKVKGRKRKSLQVESRTNPQEESRTRTQSTSGSGTPSNPAGNKSENTPSNQGVLEPMSTTYHYYIGCMNELVNKDDKLTECARLQLGVEVPKFREDTEYDKKMSKIKSWTKRNPYSRYAEEIEKLEDSTFLKRHEKPEVLEKRTKKWDIQRMREKNYCEKLRARYDASCSKSKKQETCTLLPVLEGAEKIQVCRDGKLPVSVFGESVPALQQSKFILPWLGKTMRLKGNQETSSSRRNRNSFQSNKLPAKN